jgi:hypothetical protein
LLLVAVEAVEVVVAVVVPAESYREIFLYQETFLLQLDMEVLVITQQEM